METDEGHPLTALQIADKLKLYEMDAVWGAKFLTHDNADKLAAKLGSMANESSRNILSATTPVTLKIKSSNVTTKINIDSILCARMVFSTRLIRIH